MTSFDVLVDGHRIPLTRTMLIGRTPSCDIAVQRNDEASRNHARLVVEPDGIFIEDLDSTNGTFVGSVRITEKRRLHHDDLVRIGTSLLRLERVEEDRPTVARRQETTAAMISPEPGLQAEATHRAEIFAVLARFAQRALDAGNHAEAECVTESHLERFLDEARAGMPGLDHAGSAIEIATGLARHGASTRWLDYLIQLHSALGLPIPAELRIGLPAQSGTQASVGRTSDLRVG